MRPALLFPCLLAAALAAPTKFNGINFLNGQWSPDKYNSSRAGQALATLQSTTSTSYVALTFCWFQESVDIPGPIYRKATSPTDEEIAGIVSLAHSKGISVMMRPGVDPDWSNRNTSGTWRGEIGRNFTADQWATWFSYYEPFIYYYASLAQALGADSMCVGMELIEASHQTSYWRTVVAGIRSRYSGPLLYAANHGNENAVMWWDAVDLIGVDAYYSLAPSTATPTVAELVSAWGPITTSLAALSAQYNKPIVFAEMGYCANVGANVNPAQCTSLGYSEQAQADLYTAFFQAVYPQPWFKGIFFWAWASNPDDTGKSGDSFTPSGRLAAQVMKQYYTQG